MKRTIRLNESQLRTIVSESVKRLLNEGRGNDPITKWVYWCFNYTDPDEWMDIFSNPRHLREKFHSIYQRVGSDGVMNRFFVELDARNQQALIDYVMNNYEA